MSKDNQKHTSGMMKYAGLSTQWTIMLLICVWVGNKLDEKLGWSIPLFVILFPLVSLIVSLWQLVVDLNKNKNE